MVARRAGNLATALDITSKVLPAFEALFGIPFALPKLDLIGIPDFAAGAMENWGLITYRETAVLVDPQHASLTDLRYVANVIAHEMTHQVCIQLCLKLGRPAILDSVWLARRP